MIYIGSFLFSSQEKPLEIFLSNRYLIYTVTDYAFGKYIIYDFTNKQLIVDRPVIRFLVNCNNKEIEDYIGLLCWYGEDKVLVQGTDQFNLWDIETNELIYVDINNCLGLVCLFPIEILATESSILSPPFTFPFPFLPLPSCFFSLLFGYNIIWQLNRIPALPGIWVSPLLVITL